MVHEVFVDLCDRYALYGSEDRMLHLLAQEANLHDELDLTVSASCNIPDWLTRCPALPTLEIIARPKVGPKSNTPMIPMSLLGVYYEAIIKDNCDGRQRPFPLVQRLFGLPDAIDELAYLPAGRRLDLLCMAALQLFTYGPYRDFVFGPWEEVIETLVASGISPLDQRNGEMDSILQAALKGLWRFESRPMKMAAGLQRWADALDRAGVDLTAYGRTEGLLWERVDSAASRRELCRSANPRTSYIARFVFGALPQDWSFVYRRVRDLTVCRRPVLPGAWSSNLPMTEYSLTDTDRYPNDRPSSAPSRAKIRTVPMSTAVGEPPEAVDLCCVLIDIAQDDNGAIALSQLWRQSASTRSRRKRRASQPGLLGLDRACSTRMDLGKNLSRLRPWLPGCHVSRHDYDFTNLDVPYWMRCHCHNRLLPDGFEFKPFWARMFCTGGRAPHDGLPIEDTRIGDYMWTDLLDTSHATSRHVGVKAMLDRERDRYWGLCSDDDEEDEQSDGEEYSSSSHDDEAYEQSEGESHNSSSNDEANEAEDSVSEREDEIVETAI